MMKNSAYSVHNSSKSSMQSYLFIIVIVSISSKERFDDMPEPRRWLKDPLFLPIPSTSLLLKIMLTRMVIFVRRIARDLLSLEPNLMK